MTDYALVGPANQIKFIQSATFDTCKPGWRGLPVTGDEPVYDPATQVLSGPTYTVNKDETVTRSWAILAMTAPELDTAKGAIFDGMDTVAAKIAFNHENRIRVLEGKSLITANQFKTAVKALL